MIFLHYNFDMWTYYLQLFFKILKIVDIYIIE